MPSRVLRSEILSSESLSQVSLEADLLFRSLILVADDYGRLDGRTPVLRAAVFPLRPEITAKRFEKWMGELLALPDPPVVRYVVDGRPYLELTGWEKHRGKSRRAQTSKFPGESKTQPTASPEIRENPGDPPVGMEVEVEVEAREIPADLPEPSPKARACLCPDQLEPSQRDRIVAWANERGVTRGQLGYGWEFLKDWSRSNAKKRVDWEATFRNGLRSGWVLEGCESAAASQRQAAHSADDVRANAVRKQAEDDARLRSIPGGAA